MGFPFRRTATDGISTSTRSETVASSWAVTTVLALGPVGVRRTQRRRGRSVALTVACLLALGMPATATAALPGRAIVVGQSDNGFEGNNLKSTLESLGLTVDRAPNVPSDLAAYQSVWYIEAYAGLDATEQDHLVSFSKAGGNLYLTGERPCCETLNASVQAVLRRILKDTDVQVGGLGDISGPFAFNYDVTDHVAHYPNFLVDFVPHSPGGMSGIGGVQASNVLASSSTTPVGAVWPEKDMVAGKGRVALLMDIDWLGDSERLPIIENLANFLASGGLCSNDGDHGLTWSAGPSNCSVINTPANVTWKVSGATAPPTASATPSGVTADCTTTASGNTTTLSCHLTNAAAAGAALRVDAIGPTGTITRHYRVQPKNDSRNVPPGQSLDSNWWDWPDADDDGLPDHWETAGVWVKNRLLDLPTLGADPKHKDLFLYYDYQSGHRQTDDTVNTMIGMFSSSPLSNPDGSTGVRLHVKQGASVPSSVVGDFSLGLADIVRVGTYTGYLNSVEYGGGGVPPIYKWALNFDGNDSGKHRLCGGGVSIGCGGVKGVFAWTAWDIGGTTAALGINLPIWDATARSNAQSFVQAANAAHELGHMLGLRHHGKDAKPTSDKNYKSIMSYSYSNFGLPGDGFLPMHHIDYSRLKTPNLDWDVGTEYGKLTFVYGQDGNVPDFYSANEEQPIDDVEEPPELSEAEAIMAATPESVRGFIEQFGVPASPSIPTLDNAAAVVQAGSTVDITLHGADPAGAPLTFVIETDPALGSAVTIPSGIRYTANPTAEGIEVLTVRAVNGKLGSDEATVTITVKARNQPPDVSKVRPSKDVLWPSVAQFVTMGLSGATDPDGDAVKLSIIGVTQDENIGVLSPDARLCVDRTRVQLRAEANLFADGRVYRVAFVADDGKGGTSTGVVKIAVPGSIGRPARDSAPPSYDSLATPRGKSLSYLLSQLFGGRSKPC